MRRAPEPSVVRTLAMTVRQWQRIPLNNSRCSPKQIPSGGRGTRSWDGFWLRGRAGVEIAEWLDGGHRDPDSDHDPDDNCNNQADNREVASPVVLTSTGLLSHAVP